VLVEDSAGRDALIPEHGLAFAVQTGWSLGLFDTGQTDAIVHNANVLKIDLGRVSWLALSHGHYDHTGGLPAVLRAAPGATVHAHPAVFRPKLALTSEGEWRDIGSTPAHDALVATGSPIRLTAQPESIGQGITTTGEIPRTIPFEIVGSRFHTERDGVKTPDAIPDDQALVLQTSQGVVVLLGCAHAGVVNTLEHVRRLVPTAPFQAVIGGMHLNGASEGRITETIAAFRRLDVQEVGVGHCTGEEATAAFQLAFGTRCFQCTGGTVRHYEL
jgi:7,8-dihydropterin-6-yl-methyl-4-(beta-D-ribofuranosyl)aminobenzene 5'-phosphate synthase